MEEVKQRNSAANQPKIRRKRGRPSLFRNYMIEQGGILGGFGLTTEEIASVWGVSDWTLYNWAKKHPEFSHSLKAGKEKADLRIVQTLYNAAKEGNVTAIIFWLKNRDPENWRDRTAPLIEQHTHYVKVYLPKGRKEDASTDGRKKDNRVETS